jgi:hypothetical protein
MQVGSDDWLVGEGTLVGKDESEEERKSQINLALYPNTAPQQLHSHHAFETTTVKGHRSTA